MAENKVKSEQYITVQGWMVKDLELKGNELLIYAIIFGFSQAENQTFSGSLRYLEDWTNSSKQGVIKALKSLMEKGLIEKNDKYINSVKFCEYYATKFTGVVNKVDRGGEQSLPGVVNKVYRGGELSLPNNINNTLIDNIENNIDIKKERKKASKASKTNYESIIADYTEVEPLKAAIYEFIKMRQLIKKPLTDYALSNILKKLDSYTNDDETKIQILNQSINNSWQGVFPLKDSGNNMQQQRQPATATDNFMAELQRMYNE